MGGDFGNHFDFVVVCFFILLLLLILQELYPLNQLL